MYHCRICGSVSENPMMVSAKELMYGSHERFSYFECPHCKTLQISEIPENLGDYYGSGYYSYQSDEDLPDPAEGSKDERAILDVGCGAGEFLKALYRQGKTNLTGCDPFLPQEIHYADGFHIYKKSIHEMTGCFDTIYMRDSFEHVSDPHEVLESAERLLAENGTLVISIPVYPNFAFAEFHENWYELDAPRHLQLLSCQAMELLASSHGLRILRTDFDSDWGQIVRSFLYAKDIPFFEQTKELVDFYFSEADIRGMEQMCNRANAGRIGDHATFYLKHAEEISWNDSK